MNREKGGARAKDRGSPTGGRIVDWERKERPRERLARLGAEALGDAERVASVLRTGIEGRNVVQLARELLRKAGGLSGLHRVLYRELCARRGVGPAKAAQIKAAVEPG